MQIVRATDSYSSPLFHWDKLNRIVSLSHGKEVWFCGLNESNDFVCLRKEPKPPPKNEKRK